MDTAPNCFRTRLCHAKPLRDQGPEKRGKGGGWRAYAARWRGSVIENATLLCLCASWDLKLGFKTVRASESKRRTIFESVGNVNKMSILSTSLCSNPFPSPPPDRKRSDKPKGVGAIVHPRVYTRAQKPHTVHISGRRNWIRIAVIGVRRMESQFAQ
ncbi:uncharacterized protein [Temnothorax longispinosus]|uniref:uncharacterized protein n=1 Tax=Temnothorax longispinosus TaxID=300112 RepID=UPI003A9A0029